MIRKEGQVVDGTNAIIEVLKLLELKDVVAENVHQRSETESALLLQWHVAF